MKSFYFYKHSMNSTKLLRFNHIHSLCDISLYSLLNTIRKFTVNFFSTFLNSSSYKPIWFDVHAINVLPIFIVCAMHLMHLYYPFYFPQNTIRKLYMIFGLNGIKPMILLVHLEIYRHTCVLVAMFSISCDHHEHIL